MPDTYKKILVKKVVFFIIKSISSFDNLKFFSLFLFNNLKLRYNIIHISTITLSQNIVKTSINNLKCL